MKATEQKFNFVCPKDGVLNRDDVAFLCNRCDREELLFKDGMYMCPKCLDYKKGNFMCQKCGGKEVKIEKATSK